MNASTHEDFDQLPEQVREAVADAADAPQAPAGQPGAHRSAQITRTTKETDIHIELDLDGTGKVEVDTGVPFFDHMLDAFGRHGLFDLTVRATGDIEVDAHHPVEDVGIVLGQALAQALADKRGIVRFAHTFLCMDEALVLAAVDVSGRGQLHYAVDLPIEIVGTFDTTLAKEFFIALASNAGITLHIRSFSGENSHHILEAAFKAAGRSICQATRINPRIANQLPTTKGAL